MSRIAVAAALCALLIARPLTAQIPGPGAGDGVRFGVSFGGISTVGLTAELFRDARSVELTVGTWSFSDLSVSAVARQYFGASAARPVVGAGLWMVRRPRTDNEERSSLALVLRVPIGVDWTLHGRHAVGLFVNVNRGLGVRRGNPADDRPVQNRLVPLPEVYYRLTR